MTKVFFTYVWGQSRAGLLTFASKAARSHARKVLTEGDLVFTVGTKGEPTKPQDQGRVLGVFKVSDLEVNTQYYDLGFNPNVSRFPYALHPIAVWEITSPDNMFADLVGSLTPSHHLNAQSKVVELDESTAHPLLVLERRKVPHALPKTEFGKGLVAQKNSKLAPKHQGDFTVTHKKHDVWYVYTLTLCHRHQKKPLAVKVGYSSNPYDREAAYNSPMANEVTNLRWSVYSKQPTASEDTAREIEQAVLTHYEEYKLASNGEVLSDGVDPQLVAVKIATLMGG